MNPTEQLPFSCPFPLHPILCIYGRLNAYLHITFFLIEGRRGATALRGSEPAWCRRPSGEGGGGLISSRIGSLRV